MFENYELSADQRAEVWTLTGLLDLMLGLLILGFGVGIITEAVWMGGIFLPVLLPSLLAAHKSFARRLPPGGETTPGSGRVLTTLGLVLVGLLSLGVAISFFFIIDTQQPTVHSIRTWLSSNMSLVIALLWTLIFGLIGIVTKKSRYFLYAVWALIVGTIAQIWQPHFGLAPTLTGGVVVLVGMAITYAFTRRYPEIGTEY